MYVILFVLYHMLSESYFQYFMQPGGDPLILCFVDFSTASQAAVALEALQGEMNMINIISIYGGFIVLFICRSFSASAVYTFLLYLYIYYLYSSQHFEFYVFDK